MNNQKMLDVVTMIANVILPDECDHGSALEIWLRAMKRKAREALESREREAVGNAAAMREALEAFVEYSKLVCKIGMFNRDRLVKITAKAKAALSAPARNCDVGTAEEQSDRFANLCDSHSGCSQCPVKSLWNFANGHKPSCGVLWAQMPYEAEEGAEHGKA